MANPQSENGHLRIADDLVVAICRESLSAAQYKILLSIMSMTYRVGKTKAAISQDDLRYATGEKRYTIQSEMGKLVDRRIVFVQHLPSGGRLVGIQKDYEQWLPKFGNAITSLITSNINNPPVRDLPKIGNKATPPGKILTRLLAELNIELTIGAWRKEYSKMIKLYVQALELAHEPKAAIQAIKDYFDDMDNPSFRARVTRPASYMLGGFRQWYTAIPKKPRGIRTQEEVTGYRFRYNTLKKDWIRTNEKLKPNH
jgi:hypothetical protein